MRVTLTVLVLLFVSSAFAADPDLHWVVASKNIEGATLAPLEGDRPATISGKPRLLGEPLQALVLDGKTHSLNAGKLGGLELPKKKLTVEAWVLIQNSQEWGGLAGLLQDNGDYERGFLLGFRQDRFCFALASEKAERLTYLMAKQSYEVGTWHHVAGTYDGRVMRIYVDGELAGETADQRGNIVFPPDAFLELGSYRDDNEFYRTDGMLHEVAIHYRTLSARQLRKNAEAKRGRLPALPAKDYSQALRVRGPFVEMLDLDNSVEISWSSERAATYRLVFDDGRTEEQTGRRASIALSGFEPERRYEFRIQEIVSGDVVRETPKYAFDTTFNYEVPSPPGPAFMGPLPPSPKRAARVLSDTRIQQGYCVLLGADDIEFVASLAGMSELKVVVVEPDAERVRAARKRLDASGLYGTRVTIIHSSLDRLPFGPYIANLVIASKDLEDGPKEAHRILRPDGGVLLIPGARDRTRGWLEQRDGTTTVVDWDGVSYLRHERAPLVGAGSWTHQYGGTDNAACSGDDIVAGELDVQWWGRPGPRPMPDRGPRNPAPLSVGGRLFVQGDRNLFGLDAYNGTILWALQIPEMRRANMVRDASNTAATADTLYLAMGDRCFALDAATGKRTRQFTLPLTEEEKQNDSRNWGYLAVVGDVLLGSVTPRESLYLGDQGEWFESSGSADVGKVIGTPLFALDRHTGELLWKYDGGVVFHTTVCIEKEIIYFVRDPKPDAATLRSGRIVTVKEESALTAIDLETGKERWSRPVDLSPCHHMLYLLVDGKGGRLIASGSDRNKAYHTWAFALKNGKPLWNVSDKDRKGHHGGHVQHPVIVGDRLILNRVVRSLRSGDIVERNLLERRGCGAMAAGNRAVLYRHHFHGIWDLESGGRKQLLGVRGGCWLGQIPAAGLLLAPESSAGCSCTHALQISVSFVPEGNGPAPEKE